MISIKCVKRFLDDPLGSRQRYVLYCTDCVCTDVFSIVYIYIVICGDVYDGACGLLASGMCDVI